MLMYAIMVKTANYTPNRADVCHEAIQEWKKIKSKDPVEIDEIIKQYMATPFNLYDIQTMRPKRFIPCEDPTPIPPIIRSTKPTLEIPPNASVQRRKLMK